MLNIFDDMLPSPYFLCMKGAEFEKLCSELVNGRRIYLDFLQKQNERSKMNNKAEQQIRSISDLKLMRAIPVYDKFEPNYVPLHEALNNLKVYEPLFLYNIQPGERFDRRKWLQKLPLPYLCKLYLHVLANYFENFNFGWKISKSEITYLYLQLKQ